MIDVDELLREAQAGNAEAMVELSRYYHNEREHRKSEEWADRAASAGNPTGCYLSMNLHAMDLEAARNLHVWDFLGSESAIVMERAAMLNSAHEKGIITLTSDHLQMIKAAIGEAVYGQALSAYCLDKEERRRAEIANMLTGATDTRAHVLRAVCYMESEAYRDAFRLLTQIFHDEAYATGQKEEFEEILYAEALNDLATFYRIGLPDVVEQNLTEAVNVLQYALYYVKNQDGKDALNQELARYQKKMFGGYRYV